jgi:uncharacterized membrane protein
MILLIGVPIMMGLYLVTLGLWELRVGEDRKRYVTLMFSGLVMIGIFPFLIFDLFKVFMF